MPAKRRGNIARQICLDQLLGAHRAEVCGRADDPDGADRQQRQRHRIVTGVVRELALRNNSRRRP